jgi:5-oxoprolinase (ATP-hydrolysing) subunit A
VFNTGSVVSVDLNADLAEGDELSAADVAVLASVTSVSLACGFHAGNRHVMRDTAAAALAGDVVIGAHVSFRDRDGFGRRTIEVAPAQLIDDIVEQCEVLDEVVGSVGGTVAFVKPHGALYNMMYADSPTAAAVVDAVARYGRRVIVAQAGSAVVDLARRANIRLVPEGFPDRAYLPDGRLAPRDGTGAVVEDPAAVARRAVSMVDRGGIEAVDGTWTPVEVETLCIHGDSPRAPAAAREVRAVLESQGIVLAPFVPELDSGPAGRRSPR